MATRDINGFAMHYEDVGSVFQHAWPCSGAVWAGVAPALTDRYRCITLDGRGAGESERVEEGHTSAQYAQDVLALAGALGIDQFTMIGHSSGGSVGVEVLLAAPQRVERLVLVGSFVDAGYLPPEMVDGMLGLAEMVASGSPDAHSALVGCFGSHVRAVLRSCSREVRNWPPVGLRGSSAARSRLWPIHIVATPSRRRRLGDQCAHTRGQRVS